MIVHHGISGLKRIAPGGVVSIGNFDGLHLGHRALLREMNQLRAFAESRRIAVVTFEPHPLTVLRPQHAPPRLTRPEIKQQLLEQCGVDDYVVLPPDPEVLNLSAEQFWQILRDDVRPAHLVEGDSFNFGKDRRGTIQTLLEWSAGSGVRLHVVPPVEAVLLNLHIVDVNSSLIRWLLSYGRVRDAAICLGRSYSVDGIVVEGYRRGRTIGAPTANLKVEEQLVPGNGVYAGRCEIGGTTYAAAINIGLAPTFGETRHQLEAHLIGFDGDLYGQRLRLELIDWIREQTRFSSLDDLKGQIKRDMERASDLSQQHREPRPIAAAVFA